MVFSGRPSVACHTCREKRRKCDLLRPGCTQCRRQGIPCPGYRDPFELRLRDETERVSRRLQKKQGHIGVPTAVLSPSPSLSSGPTESSGSDASALTYPHSPPLDQFSRVTDDVAIGYFMLAYITSSPFEGYLEDLYNREAVEGDALSSATQAVSFAAFATRTRDARYMDLSRKKYALALNRTNATIADPKGAILDTTLAAVLLLGLFEAIIFRGKRAPESWTAHAFGAMKLVRLRGLQQFKSDTAQQLYSQTVNNLRASCVQRIMRVPAEVSEFTESAAPFLSPKYHALSLGPIMETAAAIRARWTESKDPGIIFEALDLHSRVTAFIGEYEHQLLYPGRPKEKTPPTWTHLIASSRYPTRRAARFGNAIRLIGMFTNEFIYGLAPFAARIYRQGRLSVPDGFSGADSYWDGLRENATQSMADISSEILASVPGFIEPSESGSKFSPSARSLVWPLKNLQDSCMCPPAAAQVARDVLVRLGTDLNLPDAVNVAILGDQPETMYGWLHIYHLG